MANFPKSAEIRVTARCASGVWCELLVTDPAGTYTLPVKAGQGVLGSQSFSQVVTVFDGSPTLTIGDGSDVDGYLDNTDIALGTAASATVPAVKLFSAGGQPYAAGKVYRADDTIDWIWDPAAATTGKVQFYVALTSNFKHDGLTV